MWFVSVPPDVLSCILQSWLNIEDVGALDSAMCNTAARPQFIAALQSSTGFEHVEEEDYDYDGFLEWVVMRSIHVSFVYFPTKYNMQLLQQFFTQDRSSLKSIAYLYDENGEGGRNRTIIANLCAHCPNLNSIDLRNWMGFSQETLINIFTNCPKLRVVKFPKCALLHYILPVLASHLPNVEHLDVTNAMLDLKDDSIGNFAKSCHNLKVLRLGECSDFTDSHVAQLVAHCNQLEELSVTRGRITNASLLRLAQCCPKLIHLELDDNTHITPDGIALFARACPQLRRICLNECPRLSDAAVDALAKHCRSLEVVSISCNNWVTDASLVSLSEHCPGLRYLSVHNCPQVSDRGVFSVAQRCGHLTLVRVSLTGRRGVTQDTVDALGDRVLLMRSRQSGENEFFEFGAPHGYGGWGEVCAEDDELNGPAGVSVASCGSGSGSDGEDSGSEEEGSGQEDSYADAGSDREGGSLPNARLEF